MENYHNLIFTVSFILLAGLACTNPGVRVSEREKANIAANSSARSIPPISATPIPTPIIVEQPKATPIQTPIIVEQPKGTPVPLRTPKAEPANLVGDRSENEGRSVSRLGTGKESSRTENGYITGPRGGCYYWNSNGKKTYVDHSYCGR